MNRPWLHDTPDPGAVNEPLLLDTPELGPMFGPPVPPMTPWQRIADFLTPKVTGGGWIATTGQFTQTTPTPPAPTWASDVKPKPPDDPASFPWLPLLIGGGAVLLLTRLLGRR